MKILSYDSPFMEGIRLVVDYVLLGLLWVIACLPVITVGAATTAVLYTAEYSLRKGEGKMFRNFWKQFRKDFARATVLWLIQIPFLAVFAANLWLSYVLFSGLVQILLMVFSVMVFSWMQLWFPYLSKFDDNVKTVLGNAFRIAMGNMWKAFLMTLTVGVFGAVAVMIPYKILPVLLLVPGFFLMAYTALMRNLLKRYIPLAESDAQDAP